jgi:hypothetical protein
LYSYCTFICFLVCSYKFSSKDCSIIWRSYNYTTFNGFISYPFVVDFSLLIILSKSHQILLPIFLYQLLPSFFLNLHRGLWVLVKLLNVVLILFDFFFTYLMYVSAPQPAFLLEFSDHPHYLSFMPPYTTCLDYETHSLVFGDLSTTFLHLLLYFFASALLRLFFHLSLPANSHYVFDLPSLSGLF